MCQSQEGGPSINVDTPKSPSRTRRSSKTGSQPFISQSSRRTGTWCIGLEGFCIPNYANSPGPICRLLNLIIDALVEESLKLHSSKANQRVVEQDTFGRLSEFVRDHGPNNIKMYSSVAHSHDFCNRNHQEAVFPFLVGSCLLFGPHGTEIRPQRQ